MSELIRFGLFEFNTKVRELRRSGTVIALQSQPGQVLSHLLTHADRIVTRDELRQVIWGADTFVDFDRGLNFCISQIRSALKDNSVNPTFIRTVPKQGYQFIYPLEIPPSERLDAKINLGSNTGARRLKLYLVSALGLCLLCVTVAFLWASGNRGKLSNVAVVRFDNETGETSVDAFTDGLTDTVVQSLTKSSGGKYQVIGNAEILRRPRSQRDLEVIGTSLHAQFVVLGQVQRQGDRVRILAHLIRLPDQTHVWVVRLDREMKDPLALSAEAAEQISSEFSQRLRSK